MKTAIALTCYVVAVLVFAHGFYTEYRQTRASGPVAIVPTLPSAMQAATLLALGLFFHPVMKPWWSYPLAFIASTLIFGYAITLASARR